MATRTVPLSDLARVIRSKNAGPFELTFDVLFDRREAYEAVKRSGAIARDRVARQFGVSDNEVLVCMAYDPALAFKITLRRPIGAGDAGETDITGSQQHTPLTTLPVPIETAPAATGNRVDAPFDRGHNAGPSAGGPGQGRPGA